PIAYVTPTSHGQSDYSRALRAKAPHVSFLQEANKGLRAIASVVRRDRLERLARTPGDEGPPTPGPEAANEKLRAPAGAPASALNEYDSKGILRAYGLRTPDEALVQSVDEAVKAATAFGYPVVLKAVADTLTHKSDVGAVVLNLDSEEALRGAY